MTVGPSAELELPLDFSGLLAALRERRVVLSLENGMLRYRAAPDALTPAIMAALRVHKADLVRLLGAQAGAAAPAVSNELPLDASQAEVWAVVASGAWRPAIVRFGLRIEGVLHVRALEAALTRIVNRQDALRTRILTDGGTPRLRVEQDAVVRLDRADLTGLPVAEREQAAAAHAEAFCSEFTGLAQSPSLRALLIILGADRHILILVAPHAMVDGLSLRIIADELAAFYTSEVTSSEPRLPPLPLRYLDHVARRQASGSRVTQADVDYWRRKLDGAPRLRLPTRRAEIDRQDYCAAVFRLRLGPELTEAVRAYAARRRCSLASVLMTAFATALCYSGDADDVTFTVTTALREDPDIDHLVGWFISNHLLRLRLPFGASFDKASAMVAREMRELLAHREMTAEEVLRALRRPRGLADLQFNFVPASTTDSTRHPRLGPGLDVTAYPIAAGAATMPYRLYATFLEEEEDVSCGWVYRTAYFDHHGVERLYALFTKILDTGVVDSATSLTEIVARSSAHSR